MPLSPLRRAVLAVGSLLSAGVISTTGVSLVDWMARTSYQTDRILTTAGQQLVVDSAGDISIEPSRDGRVHVVTSVRYGLYRPSLVEESTPDGVTLRSHCREWVAIDSCQVDYAVQMPASFELRAVSTAGNITARDLTGPVHLQTSAGDIDALNLSGEVSLQTRAGDVTGLDLHSTTVTANTSAGDVTLTFDGPPTSVQARTAAGDVDVALPPVAGMYNIDDKSTAGDSSVDPSLHSSGSTRSIVLRTSAGDVRVHPTAE